MDVYTIKFHTKHAYTDFKLNIFSTDIFILFISKLKEPVLIRPETVASKFSSSKKSSIIPDAIAQFNAIDSLEILFESKLCMYLGKDTCVIDEQSSSSKTWYASN